MEATISVPQTKTAALTKLQTLYWTGQQLRPETPIFNTIQTYVINGIVEVDAFQAAFQALINSTDALRTTVKEVDGVPQRIVVDEFQFELPLLDLSQKADPAKAYSSWIDERRKRPLILHDSLFDTTLLKLSDSSWVWYFNQHHILLDALSSQLIFDRVATFYQHQITERPLPQTDFPSFSEYVSFAADYETSAKYEKASKFWEKRLSPGPEPVTFFGKQPRKLTANVRRHTLMLERGHTAKLEDLAARKGIYAVSEDMSITAVFSTLFFTLLHKLSGNERLGYINPVHNRVTDAAQQTIGLLMELCPVQMQIKPDDTFLKLIKKMHRETFATMPHSQFGSHATLPNGTFEAMFNFHHLPPTKLGDLPVQQHVVHSGAGSDSLALHIHHYPSTDAYHLHFDFHEDLFSTSEQAQTIQLYETIFEAFLDDPGQEIGPLLEKLTIVSTPAVTQETAVRQPFEAPRTPLETTLQRFWQDVLSIEQIGIHDNFFQLGGDSWQAVRLFAHIEEETGQKLPLSLLIKASTIAALANAIDGKPQDEGWSPLVPIQTLGNRSPFFCVHGVFGNVLNFYRLSELLGSDQPFYGLQPQGINGDERALTDIPSMASLYLEAVRSVQPQGPYHLGGYSLGGEVAMEMAQQLSAAGEEVAIVVLLDTHEPDAIRVKEHKMIKPTAASTKMFAEEREAWHKANRARKGLTGPKKGANGQHKAAKQANGRLQKLMKKEPKALAVSGRNWVRGKWTNARQSVRRLTMQGFMLRYRWGGIQLRLGRQIPQSITQYYLWGSHITALVNYRPKAYDGKVLLFRASQSIPTHVFDPSIRWEEIVRDGELSVVHLETVHNDLLDEPIVSEIGTVLRQTLLDV